MIHLQRSSSHATAGSDPGTVAPCCASTPPSRPEGAAARSCCGDPTPVASTGACCSDPAPTCGCGGSTGKGSHRAPLPVAVIGAGPIGLAAAAHLLARGERPLVLERGANAGASIREWGHVRLFTPWRYLVDPAMRALLEPTGWRMPAEDVIPTGSELVEQLLQPLAGLPQVAPYLRFGHEVLAVTRRGFDKARSAGRDDVPFELIVRHASGTTERLLARAVVDASGTWLQPNPMGAGGVPAEGEIEAAAHVRHGVPDVLGRERARYAGRRVLVVGSGHSAFNALLDLAALRNEEPVTTITWAIRRASVGLLFGGGHADALEARGALGDRVRTLVESGAVTLELGMRIARVTRTSDGLVMSGDDGRALPAVDEIVVAAGFRPDLSLTRELRLGLDPWLEAPVQLAPLVDPNLHSCGTVHPHGAEELGHPERDYYVVGMKSYGRAPTFLLLTGYEQVRSVACRLTGDEAGARTVQLLLPETGVCSTGIGGSSCCGSSCSAEPLALARAS